MWIVSAYRDGSESATTGNKFGAFEFGAVMVVGDMSKLALPFV